MLQKYFAFEILDVVNIKAAVFLCFRHEAVESGRIVQTLQGIFASLIETAVLFIREVI